MRIIIILFFLSLSTELSFAQDKNTLRIEEIMDDKWIGISPDNIQWDLKSQDVFFRWNPKQRTQDDLYQISVNNYQPLAQTLESVRAALQKNNLSYSKDRTRALFERGNDIILVDVTNGKETKLTNTKDIETNPVFNDDETKIVYRKENNLYAITLSGGILTQLTNFLAIGEIKQKLTEQASGLQEKQINTFQVLRSRAEEQKKIDQVIKERELGLPKAFYFDGKSAIGEISVSPDMRFIAFNVEDYPTGNRNIIVPDYVTSSGYTELISGRTKVGSSVPTVSSYIYDRQRDSIYPILKSNIPGIKDLPSYLTDYPIKYKDLKLTSKDREIQLSDFKWNAVGSRMVANVFSQDHKDRWIMKVDPLNGILSLLDRQHDDAWINMGGFGYGNPNILGWVNNENIYFLSEASGYSHIFIINVEKTTKQQLTSGNYEVQSLQLSNDHQSFYFSANLENSGVFHFYKLPVSKSAKPEKITTMDGGNQVVLSPDEKWLAIRHSYIDKPWELYLQRNIANSKPVQITHSTTPAFNAYKWKIPETLIFKNRYGIDVHAQIFKPKIQNKNKSAIVFVHSNGYLQNVNYGWSYHYREYMFNNLLVDQGYTIINIDYTGSAGYGRNFRTGIYRHMGGTDLTDLVDGTKLLIDKYNVNPLSIGLYGGSYGGFLTLMALFTESEVFKSGAALRSVTDWLNYNQRYTSNILNDPLYDLKAYRQSSPLFFAEGLKGHLLITHGVIDVNVNFQDDLLLVQRLIELRKDNWEEAVYPLEDHEFVHTDSWIDQYKRIWKLFNNTLNGQ